MKFIRLIWQILLIAAFAMWFGGFGFYVSFVVPIGTEVLGSSFDQGLITRKVTVPLNCLAGFAIAMMLIESSIGWKSRVGRSRTIQLLSACLMAVMLASLFYLHPRIDSFVDADSFNIVGDYEQFYFLHRLYLWASTVQWLAAWVWLSSYVCGLQSSSRETESPI